MTSLHVHNNAVCSPAPPSGPASWTSPGEVGHEIGHERGFPVFEPVVITSGVVTSDPESQELDSGVPLTRFRLMSTSRRRDGAGEWRDNNHIWMTVTSWRQLAGNVAASLRKGDHVTVHGRLEVHEWDGTDGKRRILIEVHAEHIGPDLLWGTAVFRRGIARRHPGEAGQGEVEADSKNHSPQAADSEDSTQEIHVGICRNGEEVTVGAPGRSEDLSGTMEKSGS
jgi:single-strand DNA-binding protein